MSEGRKSVLFLCTHNSARSQIAEGLLRAFGSDKFKAFSAGTEPSKVNPYVIRAMSEIGIDLISHRSKHVSEYSDQSFDYVVTVCDNAKEACPFFPGKKVIHQSFDDPSAIKGSDDEIMAGVRTIRDKIGAWLKATFNTGS